jgi:hypothetical protein
MLYPDEQRRTTSGPLASMAALMSEYPVRIIHAGHPHFRDYDSKGPRSWIAANPCGFHRSMIGTQRAKL